MDEDGSGTAEISTGNRPLLMGCGLVMILVAAAAAVLPFVRLMPGAAVVGWLLLIAGAIELAAARASHIKGLEGAWRTAGAITILAGLLFVLNPLSKLVPLSYIVMAWLFVRSAVLLGAAIRTRASRKIWIMFSGTADLLLALMLLVGLPIATLVSGLFGATVELVAGFALVLAASFAVTGAAFFGTADAEPRV